MLVSPSILAADFADLKNQIKLVETADLLHVDVMDGCFVPNISIGPAVVKAIRPHSSLDFDVHLMISHPLNFIESFAAAGADMISFHPESGDDCGEVIEKIHACGKKAGLAIKPKTPVSEILPYGERLHIVTIMTVEPGFGGQAMMQEHLSKAAEIKRAFPHILTCVDGGVNRDTRAACERAGLDILVAGTAVFGAADPKREIEFLKTGK